MKETLTLSISWMRQLKYLCIGLFFFTMTQPVQAQYFFNEYTNYYGDCPTEVIVDGNGYQILTENRTENEVTFKNIMIDANGQLVYSGGSSFDITNSQNAYRLSDGNVLLAEVVGNTWVLTKKAFNGEPMWFQTINLPGAVGLGDNLKNGPNGEIFLAGPYPSNDAVYTVKLTATGQLIWDNQLVPNQLGPVDGAYVSAALSDGSVVVVGKASTGISSTQTTRAFKLSAGSGTFIWDNYSSLYPVPQQLIEPGFSTNVFSAFSYSRVRNFSTENQFANWDNNAGYYNAREYSFSGSNGSREFKTALEATNDGGVLVGGYHVEIIDDGSLYHREMHLAKFDANGELEWLVNDYPIYGLIKTITELEDGNILLAGTRGEFPWAMVVNSEGLPTDNPCSEEIPGYTFEGEKFGNYYFLSDNNLPYTQAQAQAQQAGGYLASIEASIENSFVWRMGFDANEYVYIGLNDLANEGNPSWDSGEPLTYINDCPSCPMNNASNDVVSMPTYDDVWNWESGDAYRRSVMEFECPENFEGIANNLPENDGMTDCFSTDNLILYKRAKISSTNNPYGEAVAAAYANDGQINGPAAISTFENQPYWITTLEDAYDMETIEIYPGANGIGDFYVLTSIAGGVNPQSLAESLNNSFIEPYFVPASSTGPIIIPLNDLAVSVRIQLAGAGILDLSEVRLFGCSRYEDIHVPEYFDCPDDIVLTAGANGTATPQWDPTVVTQNGCYGAGNGGSGFFGPQPGDALTPGEYLVEYYTSNDFCGNQHCRFNITILPNDGGSGTLTTTCPTDQTFTAPAGQNSTVPNWSLPVGSTTCAGGVVNVVQSSGPSQGASFSIGTTTVSYSITDNCGNVETCSFNIIVEQEDVSNCTENINGFTFLGSYNNHNYFLSNTISNWQNASGTAASLGGYLASVNDANENEFIRSQIGSNMVFIGYNDAQVEGNFSWDSGENIAYTNIAGSNSSANDYAVMNFWAGSWTFDGATVKRPYVLEVECDGDTNTGNLTVNCPSNQTAVGAAGSTSVFTSWTEPTGSTTCPGGAVNIVQNTNFTNGTEYPTSTVLNLIYTITDACGNSETCSFTVSVSAEPGGGDCPDNISGFTVLGEFGNSKYYISNNTANWPTAQSIALSNGGHLASFSTAEENSFVTGLINDLVFIGYNDADGNGTYSWDSGEAVTYTNYQTTTTDGYAHMNFWNGQWAFDGQWTQRRFVIELSCGGDPCICTTEYVPVCAEGTTFGNACEAECAGFFNYTDGACVQTGGPDLSITNYCCLSDVVYIGAVEGFTFELSNLGDATAAEDYIVGIYLSTDQNFSNNDYLVGEVFTGNTPVGSIPNIAAAINVTNATPEGDYYLIIVADAFNEVAESNESNNVWVDNAVTSVFDGDVNTCPDNVPGYTLIGENGNSKYFISNASSTWSNAQVAAASNGGHLVSFNTSAENDYVKSLISEIVFIGLNDVQSEGNLVWDDGTVPSFDNSVSPNSAANDFGSMNFWDGGWSFDGIWTQRKSIMELPCSSSSPAPVVAERNGIEAEPKVSLNNLYPNPTNNDLFLQLNSDIDQNIKLMIIDINGKEVMHQRLSLTTGMTTHQIEVNELPAGVYCVVFPNGNGAFKTSRFVKGVK